MKHRLRSALWALWYVLRYDNQLSFRRGYVFIRKSRVDNSDVKNGVVRIPLFRGRQ